MNSKPHSIVEFYGGGDIGSKCGYCKSPNTNCSSGMWAHSLTVSDYQDLVDRGWRRSGSYCYKPSMDSTCCPMYTIRCRVTEFKMSKSQKKVLKRFNKQLAGDGAEHSPGDTRKMSTGSSGGDTEDSCVGAGHLLVQSAKLPQNINVKDVNSIVDKEQYLEPTNSSQHNVETKEVEETVSQSNVEKQLVVKKGFGADPEKAPCKKAKQLRRERKLEKLKEKGVDVASLDNTSKCKEKQLEDLIDELPDNIKDKLEIRLVRTSPPSAAWRETSRAAHDVFSKYQALIHDDRDTSFSRFSDFLAQSPLVEEYSESGPPCGYGSFHQQYWVRGKLIAVGVIDILPKCVSSVYFFYDPLYMSMTLGTYGALRSALNPFDSDVEDIPSTQPASKKSSSKPKAPAAKKSKPRSSKASTAAAADTSKSLFGSDTESEAEAPPKKKSKSSRVFPDSDDEGDRTQPIRAAALRSFLSRRTGSGYTFQKDLTKQGAYYVELTVTNSKDAEREIAFTRHLHSVAPDLKYYYMGYYIHSCRKMRYKGQYHPSDLLCPETYNWTPITEAIPKLEASPYSRLDPDLDSLDTNSPTLEDIDYIRVLVNHMAVRYKVYKRKFAVSSRGMEEVVKYAGLVGRRCARNMVLVK